MRFLTQKRLLFLFTIVGVYALYSLAFASGGGEAGAEAGEGHGGPVLTVLMSLIVILLAAKLGGDLFERVKQPAVLGELIIGMVIGNLHLVGFDGFDIFKHDVVLEVLAEIGVIILLFQVGLESTVKEMMKVGAASFMVAVLGVVAPFFLGWGVGAWFLPEAHTLVHVFIGATLTATSVGITARVLKDIGKVNTKEAKIILGAAVIDDILGLVILAVVAGIITAAGSQDGGNISSLKILQIILTSVGFVAAAIIIGSIAVPSYFKQALKLRVKGVLLSVALLVCFGLSYFAGELGLAPIVGAFAAGLILEEFQFRGFRDRGEHNVEELVEPIATFLVPIFFVRMGMMVDLSTFGETEVLGFAAVLTLAAIIGKQACSLGILDKSVNRLAVGLGMIPRGEVGLIFAGIGAALMLGGKSVIDIGTYSAVVIMVIVTTLVTPPVLKSVILRKGEARKSQETVKPKSREWLEGFSWGAFFWGPLWLFFHGQWRMAILMIGVWGLGVLTAGLGHERGILVFLSICNISLSLHFGTEGRSIARQYRPKEDIAVIKRSERVWGIAALIWNGLVLVLLMAMFFFAFFQRR